MIFVTRALVLAAILPLAAACSMTSVQTDQAKIASAISIACADANAAAALAAPFAAEPHVAGVLTFITAGCGTAEAVSGLVGKALADPSTIAWAERLAAQVKDAVAKFK